LHEFSKYGTVYLVEKSEAEFQLWGLSIDIYMKQTVRIGWQHFWSGLLRICFQPALSRQYFLWFVYSSKWSLPSDLPTSPFYAILISSTHVYVPWFPVTPSLDTSAENHNTLFRDKS